MIESLRLVARDGVATGARVSGSSGPALLFVHGVGSTAAIWDEQLRALATDFRCAAVELRGNGAVKPEPDPGDISRAGYARDVLAVMDALRFERATIVGCSLGGVVAMELWLQASARVEAMVLLGTFARYPNARAYADGIADSVRRAGNMAVFAAERAAKLGLPPQRDAETRAQMACKETASYLAATEATWTGDYRAMLPTVGVPVLICVGERDSIAPPALSAEIAQLVPSAEMLVLPQAGHVANADNPAAFNDALSGFVRRSSFG